MDIKHKGKIIGRFEGHTYYTYRNPEHFGKYFIWLLTISFSFSFTLFYSLWFNLDMASGLITFLVLYVLTRDLIKAFGSFE